MTFQVPHSGMDCNQTIIVQPLAIRPQLNVLPGGLLPIMDYTGRLRPKGVPFLGWRYIKG